MDDFNAFKTAVEASGLAAHQCASETPHWQIKGGQRIVNIWPETNAGPKMQMGVAKAVRLPFGSAGIASAIAAAGLPAVGKFGAATAKVWANDQHGEPVTAAEAAERAEAAYGAEKPAQAPTEGVEVIGGAKGEYIAAMHKSREEEAAAIQARSMVDSVKPIGQLSSDGRSLVEDDDGEPVEDEPAGIVGSRKPVSRAGRMTYAAWINGEMHSFDTPEEARAAIEKAELAALVDRSAAPFEAVARPTGVSIVVYYPERHGVNGKIINFARFDRVEKYAVVDGSLAIVQQGSTHPSIFASGQWFSVQAWKGDGG